MTRTRKLGFAAVAVVLVLGGAELLLTLAGFAWTPVPERIRLGRLRDGIPTAEVIFDRLVPGLFTRDPLLFWKPVAGRPPFNAAGLRDDRELPGTRDPGELRVLTLGDSCTFLGEPLPWPAVMEDLLAGRTGGPVRALNAAVPAWTSLQGRRYLETRGAALDPDVVTVYFGWNDHWRATEKPDSEWAVPGEGVAAVQRILSRLRLYQLFHWLSRGRPAGGGNPAPPLSAATDPATGAGKRPFRVPESEFEANLQAMVAVIRSLGARPVLITAPSTLTGDRVPEYLFVHGFVAAGGESVEAIHQRYAATVRRVARETGAVLVDAAQAFRRAPQEVPLMRDDGIHLTAAGIRLMAGLVATALTPEAQAPPPAAPSEAQVPPSAESLLSPSPPLSSSSTSASPPASPPSSAKSAA